MGIRPGGKASIDADALGIRSQMQQYKDSHSNGNNSQNQEEKTENKRQYGKFDSSALHIQHALRATEVQRKYSKKSEEPIEAYLDREEQIRLEAKHKEEEDRLYKQFIEQRDREAQKVLSSVPMYSAFPC